MPFQDSPSPSPKMAGSSSEEAVEVNAQKPRYFVVVGISIIYILVMRMGEDAAERYCVSFLQNLFYESTISGRSWRGNSKILLNLHCTCCTATQLVVRTHQTWWCTSNDCSCCQNSSEWMEFAWWCTFGLDFVLVFVWRILWRKCFTNSSWKTSVPLGRVGDPLVYSISFSKRGWKRWKLRRGKFRSNHPPTLG